MTTSTTSEPPAPDRTCGWTIEEIGIPAKDGETLSARVVRPTEGSSAVLLIRTPYVLGDVRFNLDLFEVIRRGLGLVMVNHRGTGASTGIFDPWQDEVTDGHDCIEWCATQPWSNGTVVTHGGSYLAQTQLFAASSGHPALRAMSAEVCPSDPYDIFYSDGVLRFGLASTWAIQMALLQLVRPGRSADALPDLDPDPVAAFAEKPSASLGALDPYFPQWRDWIDHPTRDSYWADRAIPARPPIPTLFRAGWYDIFLNPTVREFTRHPDPRSRLIIGPWEHGRPERALAEVDYGPTAAGVAQGLDQETLDFLAAHAAGRPPRERPRVRYFLMGANEWQASDSWPPTAATSVLYLAADGALRLDRPMKEGRTGFIFDPLDPTPTVGGANLPTRGPAAYGAGSWDQRQLDHRNDLTRFETEALDQPLDMIGNVTVQLFTSTSAVDSDWTAKLVDVQPEGNAFNVIDGVVRQRYATGVDQLIPPGTVAEVDVDLGATAYRFLPGHRIRLEIASANYPRFEINPGNGSTVLKTGGSKYPPMQQTVYFGGDRSSRLTAHSLGRLARHSQADDQNESSAASLLLTEDL